MVLISHKAVIQEWVFNQEINIIRYLDQPTVPEKYFDIPHREGYFELADYDLYYRAFGSGETALLGLHGGPGGSSVGLAPLAGHGSEELTVYLYDQFGAGRSDRPADGDFDRYMVGHYRQELDAVRQAVGVEDVILYGHSWGGMLALEYVLAYPDRVSKLLLSGTLHDVAEAFEVMKRARQEELSEAELETVREYEASRDFDNPEYQELTQTVYSERLLRGEKPIWVEKYEPNMDLYGLMWGPTEFALAETARLRGWSVTDRLSEINVPTLVLVGEHDEIGPEISRDIAARIPGAHLEVLEDASHYSCWDTPERHFEIVDAFLTE